MFIKKLALFVNLRQKLFLIVYLLNQLVLTFIEMVSLSLIPIFIFYLQDLNAAKLKIEEINSFLNLEILNLDINILIKYFFFGFVSLFFIKNFLLVLANYFELHIIRDITRSNLIKLFKKFINQSFNVIIRKDYASFMRNLISETAKSTAYIIAHVNILKEIIMLIAVFTILLINDYAVSMFVLVFFVITSFIFLFYLKGRLLSKRITNTRQNQK